MTKNLSKNETKAEEEVEEGKKRFPLFRMNLDNYI